MYLNDIVRFCKTAEEPISHVKQVVLILQKTEVTLKLKIVASFTNTIDYLGHVLKPRRPENYFHITVAMNQLKEPCNVSELRSFLRLDNVLGQFISNFVQIATLPNCKPHEHQPKKFWFLINEEWIVMRTFQESLIALPILELPLAGGRYTLETDSCNIKIGCTLVQEQLDKTKNQICYWSRSLTKAQIAFDPTQREC